MQVSPLAECDQLINDAPQLFCLGQRRHDLLVLDQCGGHIREHRLAVTARPIKFPRTFTVSHCNYS